MLPITHKKNLATGDDLVPRAAAHTPPAQASAVDTTQQATAPGRMQKRRASRTVRTILSLASAFICWQGITFAQPTSSDYIPPDVTVPQPGAPNTPPSSISGSGPSAPGAGSFFTPSGFPFNGGASPAGSAAGQPALPPGMGGPAGRLSAPGQNAPAGAASGPRPGFPGAAATTQASQMAARRDPIAIIQTSKGPIVLRLFRKLAPATVAHFSEIAQTGFYNGLNFHRVVPGQLIQTGCPNGNGSGFYTDPVSKQPKFIGVETNPNLKHNAAGVVGMARVGRSTLSASSQFYITLSPQPSFDGAYSIFGGVVSGMEVVNQIQQGDRIVSIVIQEQQ